METRRKYRTKGKKEIKETKRELKGKWSKGRQKRNSQKQKD